MIAMALVHNPDVLIADEPTTALDVTVQAQILELIDRVKKEFDIGVILITHDLGVVAETATHVHGHVRRPRDGVRPCARRSSTRPSIPYTWGLLESMPTVDRRLDALVAIEGSPPSLLNPPPGCPFHPRCKYRFDAVRQRAAAARADPRRPSATRAICPPSASARSGRSASASSSASSDVPRRTL